MAENENITEKAFSLQKEPKERFLGQSQDILNIVFDGTNAFLPSIYNEFGGGEDDPSKKGQSFIGQGGANHGRWSCPIMMLSGGPIMRPLRGDLI